VPLSGEEKERLHTRGMKTLAGNLHGGEKMRSPVIEEHLRKQKKLFDVGEKGGAEALFKRKGPEATCVPPKFRLCGPGAIFQRNMESCEKGGKERPPRSAPGREVPYFNWSVVRRAENRKKTFVSR